MQFKIVAVSAISFIFSTSIALAVPFNFTPGQPARAADVNANFADVEAKIQANTTNITTNTNNINTNATNISNNAAGVAANAAAIAALPVSTSYDYRNYSAVASIQSKSFALGGVDPCDTEVQNFARATVGDTTTLTMTRVRTVSGGPCRYHVFKYKLTPSGDYIMSEDTYSNDGSVLMQSVSLDTAVLLRGADMRLGMATADAATTTVSGGSAPVGTYVEKTTLVGIESVTVPYNSGTTYNGCLKIHTFREATQGFGNGLLNRVSWFCPDVGFVKGIQSNGISWALTGITYASP